MKAVLRWMVVVLLSLAVVASADAVGRRRRGNLLEETQTAYSVAIRWGEFEKAWELVDPAYREANPLTELALERYAQVQVSGYRDLGVGGSDADGTISRSIELRVINRHTMAERTVRYQERWRWDEEAKRWWQVDGLPDLWNGQ